MTLRPIDDEHVAEVLSQALPQGALRRREDTAAIFYCFDVLDSRLDELRAAFPPSALHAVAVKANPALGVLRHVVQQGFGLEAASLAELELAVRSGAPPQDIVFDSPAKTEEELRRALELGVRINTDNLQEIEQLARLREDEVTRSASASVGLRVNPQVGVGPISYTSVAGQRSKFGVPLDQADAIADALVRYPWISGLHVHVGSQLGGVELLVEGIARVSQFMNEVNRRRPAVPIAVLDIGGGLTAPYSARDEVADLQTYADALRRRCPELFGADLRLVTEFGRHVHTNAGWIATRVEYVKPAGDVITAVVHVGADLLMRACYLPEDWTHEILVLSAAGELKRGPRHIYDIAGPLCFAGDFVGRGRELPEIEPGDYIVLLDAGSYTHSMWSRYNSRQAPRVIGYRRDNTGKLVFEVLIERETTDDVLRFWS